MALSELRDQVFFVAEIAFEFELKVLTNLEFHANVSLINIFFLSFICCCEIGRNRQKCSLLNWIQSDQKRWTFFVAWIVFEFELKVLTVLDFRDKFLPIYIVFYHSVVSVKLKKINKKCSLLSWIQSDQKRWTYFVAWIAFKFESKALTVVEFYDRILLIYIVFYHLFVFVKSEEIGKNVVCWIEFSQTKIEDLLCGLNSIWIWIKSTYRFGVSCQRCAD